MSALCADEFRRDVSSEAALLRVNKPTMDERGTWIKVPAILIDGTDKRVLREMETSK
jgi:hypothetical protein